MCRNAEMAGPGGRYAARMVGPGGRYCRYDGRTWRPLLPLEWLTSCASNPKLPGRYPSKENGNGLDVKGPSSSLSLQHLARYVETKSGCIAAELRLASTK